MPEVASIPSSTEHQRTRRLLEGALSATASKAAVLLTNALAIPITIRYLGTESFGVWTTISTLLSMLLVLDFGVANSLTNFISEAYAREDREHASTYATTAMGIMTVAAMLIAVSGCLIWPMMHWDRIFHLSAHGPSEALVSRAVAAAFVVFLLGLPASLAPKILGGYQELRSASLFQAVGSVFNLLLLIVLARRHAGLVALTTASAGALVLGNYLCLVWIWFFHKPWLAPRPRHLSRIAARRVMRSGGELFILQIAALVVFNSDNLVVAHFLGPVEVASYSVTWRLVSYAAIAQTLIAPALWPAFSEAFSRNDLPWIRRTYYRTLRLTTGVAFGFTLVLAVAGRAMIAIWAGPQAVPSHALVLLMCAWILLSTVMNNVSIVLTSRGDTRLQAWCSVLAAVLNLVLSIYWVQRIGSIGVILGTIVSYLAVVVVPVLWKVSRILSGNDRLGELHLKGEGS